MYALHNVSPSPPTYLSTYLTRFLEICSNYLLVTLTRPERVPSYFSCQAILIVVYFSAFKISRETPRFVRMPCQVPAVEEVQSRNHVAKLRE